MSRYCSITLFPVYGQPAEIGVALDNITNERFPSKIETKKCTGNNVMHLPCPFVIFGRNFFFRMQLFAKIWYGIKHDNNLAAEQKFQPIA